MKSQIGVRRSQGPHRFILTPVSVASVPSSALHSANCSSNSSSSTSSSTSSSSQSSADSQVKTSTQNSSNPAIVLTATPAPASVQQQVNQQQSNTLLTNTPATSEAPHPPLPPQIPDSLEIQETPIPQLMPASPLRSTSTSSSTHDGYPTPPPSSGAGPFPGVEDDFGVFCFPYADETSLAPGLAASSSLLFSSPTAALSTSPIASSFSSSSFYEYQNQSPLSSCQRQNHTQSQSSFVRQLVRDCMWSPDHSTTTSPVNFENDVLISGLKIEPQQPHNPHPHSHFDAAMQNTASFINPSSVLPRMCSCSVQSSCGGGFGGNGGVNHHPSDLDTPKAPSNASTLFATDDECCDPNCLDLFHHHHQPQSQQQQQQQQQDINQNGDFGNHHGENAPFAVPRVSAHRSHLSSSYSNATPPPPPPPSLTESCCCARKRNQQRSLTSVLKRPEDLFEECTDQLMSTAEFHHVSISAPVSPQQLDQPASKRIKRSKSPTVITLPKPSDPILDDDSTSMSYTSAASYPVDITSHHSYTRNPCLRVAISGPNSSGDQSTMLVQPLSSSGSTASSSSSSPSAESFSPNCNAVHGKSSTASTPASSTLLYSNNGQSHQQNGHQHQHHHAMQSNGQRPQNNNADNVGNNNTSCGQNNNSNSNNNRQTASKRSQSNRHSTAPHRPSAKRKNPNDHIKMERERRNDLKATFHHVREEVPELSHLPKPSKLAILDKAREYIETMKTTVEEMNNEKSRLLRQNEAMMARLEALQRSAGLVSSSSPTSSSAASTPAPSVSVSGSSQTPTNAGYVIVSAGPYSGNQVD